MDPAPHAAPVTLPADPDRTGARSIGVLLSHGFTGSPASMRPWAEHLGSLGYAVSAPCLPGHGTTWQDLATRTWDDWYGAARAAFEQLAAQHDTVVVGGLSMGGAIVLRLAAEHADRVAGVMVVNPAVASGRLDVKALPVLKHVLASLPGIADDIKKPGVSEQGYTRTPLKAIHSFISSWPETVRALPRVTAPVHYWRSSVDHVVDGASEPLIRRGVSGPITLSRLEESYHVATLDNDAPRIFEESAAFVEGVAGIAGLGA